MTGKWEAMDTEGEPIWREDGKPVDGEVFNDKVDAWRWILDMKSQCLHSTRVRQARVNKEANAYFVSLMASVEAFKREGGVADDT